VPSLVLAWLITFGIMFMLGCIAFWTTQTFGIVNFYFGVWSLFSGYIIPMDLMRAKFPTLVDVADWMPFYYMLAAPVELMTKHLTTTQLAQLLGAQVAWAVISIALGLWVWRKGVRHFEAVGN
jgi:ABC-2 type transport system permease protein